MASSTPRRPGSSSRSARSPSAPSPLPPPDSAVAQKPPAEPEPPGLVRLDPWLKPYEHAIRRRLDGFQRRLDEIRREEGSLLDFARGYEEFGFIREEHEGKPGVWYREWAPGAEGLFLTGDFNNWNRRSEPMTRDDFGVWSIFLPDDVYASRLVHGSRVKVHVISSIGPMDRIPAWIRRAVYQPELNAYIGQYWNPPEPYVFRHPPPPLTTGPRVYEAHVGMALEEERVGSYNEFTERMLPRIASAGYNVIQLMAVQEHPYYASFGYHVSNFFAASSRFGTPEDLKRLIDTAHGMGLRVIMDLIHSHAVKNVHDGLNLFDGTNHHYFHAPPRGDHPAWDSRVFDYSRWEVLRFLLSNVRFWLDEYRFDGFRLDGITSMMYVDHGLARDFRGYDDYFGDGVDEEAVRYLQLANHLAHELRPDVMMVAEDVSGMAGLARPVEEGGIGFDFRLAMGIPDYWIKLLKERRDEEWHMGELYHTLANRRHGERHIAYAESHDQALVGDKTLAFWLMDKDMYWLMSKVATGNVVIERGMALHKMIRLITFLFGGEGYLNFMGNEFGHPEWIDFPREGNHNSYKYARRQWSLAEDPLLRYRDLAAFDKAMTALDEKYNVLSGAPQELIHVHEDAKTVVARRGDLVAIFNFHPQQSHTDYRLGIPAATDYKLILNTDDFWFGGHGIVQTGEVYPMQKVACDHRAQSTQIYIPSRTAQILAPV